MDNKYFQEHVQYELNELSLRDFENIKVGDMLHYVCHVYDPRCTPKNIVKIIYHFLRRMIFYSNTFKVTGTGDTLFLLSNSYYGRADYARAFAKVASCVSNKMEMSASRKYKLHLSFLGHILYIIPWNKELKKKLPSIWDRWFIMDHLYMILSSYKEYELQMRKQKVTPKQLVTWCDIHSIDYYFTQRFNQTGNTTITLQHGLMIAGCNDWVLRESHSKYFFAHGEFTIKEAQKAGYRNGVMVPVGIPALVKDEPVLKRVVEKTDTIGLILDGDELYEDNLILIRFMLDFCKDNNCKVIVKLHPASDKSRYTNLWDSHIVKGIYGSEISIYEFADLIDLAVVKSSTCLIELLGMLVPTFIYENDNLSRNVYKEFPHLKFFDNATLIQCMEDIRREDFTQELDTYREFFGAGKNITANYIEHFHKLGIH